MDNFILRWSHTFHSLTSLTFNEKILLDAGLGQGSGQGKTPKIHVLAFLILSIPHTYNSLVSSSKNHDLDKQKENTTTHPDHER
ncbi:hypothetical protein M758_1G022700 [Ceratodon purpureus]|nr:hypothetical protein M758_1G022700 [Ceratodon purpureus]